MSAVAAATAERDVGGRYRSNRFRRHKDDVGPPRGYIRPRAGCTLGSTTAANST